MMQVSYTAKWHVEPADLVVTAHFKNLFPDAVLVLLAVTYLAHPRVSISEMSWE